MSSTLSGPIAPERSRHDRRWRLAVIGLAVVVLGVATFVAVQLSRPDAAHSLYGGTGGLTTAPMTVGQTRYSLPTVEPIGDRPKHLDLRSVRPNIDANSAHATVRVLVCIRNNAPMTSLDLRPSICARTRPFAPSLLNIAGVGASPGQTMIIFAVTPHRAGKVLINGARVDYYDGDRHGNQTTGTEIAINTRSD